MEKETYPVYDGLAKLHSSGRSVTLTIRRPFCRSLGFREGMTVLCRIVDGALVVRPFQTVVEEGMKALEERDAAAVEVTTL